MKVPKRFKIWHELNKDIPVEMLKCPKCKNWFDDLDYLAPYHWERCWCDTCQKYLHEINEH